MTSMDTTAFQAMLKELYPDDEPMNVATRNRPFLKMVSKKDDFEGDVLVVPFIHEYPNGRSADFATAQTNAKPSLMAKWVASVAEDHQVVTISALVMRQSRSKRGAFVEARKTEIDSALLNLGRSASHALYSTGGGAIGQIATGGISTTTATLTNAADVANFGIGMVVVADTVDGTGTVNSGSLTVASRDEDAGTVTFTANVTTGIASAAAGDYFFVQGDYGLKMKGLQAHFPLSAPTGGDSFYGVDRSIDPLRMAGVRLNATGNSIEENILTVAEKCVQNGGMPDTCFLNHTNFSNLVKGLGSKVEYQDAGGDVAVGFRSVAIHCSSGVVKVVADPSCPANRGFVLQLDTLCLHHLDGFPHLDTIDGNSGLRQATSDGIEVRARYWGNLLCRAPAYNGTFAI